MKKKHTFLQPTYYKEFKCSGSECKINCCSYNWGIKVDKETYLKYRKIKEPKELLELLNKYVKRNRNNLDTIDYAKLVHIKEEIEVEYSIIEDNQEKKEKSSLEIYNCPFQTEDNLCLIQKKLGFKYLCNTCKTYPRTINNIFNNYERSLYIGCEEVSKLFYNMEEGICFELIEEENSNQFTYNFEVKFINEMSEYFDDIRLTCIQILQYREISLDNRMILLSIFMFKINELFNNNKFEDIDNYINNFFNNIDMYEEIFNINLKKQHLIIDILLDITISSKSGFCKKDLFLEISDILVKFGKCYIEINNNDNSNNISPTYESYKKNYKKLIKGKEYFIENIFVNMFFINAFPFNGINNIRECCIIFIFNYIYYKGLLAGYLGDKDVLDENTLHKISVIFGRTSADQYNKSKAILTVMKELEIDSLAFLAVLIKSA